MSEGFWELNKALELNEIANNSFSVVNYAGIRIFKNPQDRGKIHAVFGQIGRFLCWVEFQLHVSNVCLIDSYLKPHFGGLRSVGAFSPSALSLSQSHGEHGGVSEFPRASISAQTPLCAPRHRVILSKNPYSDLRWSANFPPPSSKSLHNSATRSHQAMHRQGPLHSDLLRNLLDLNEHQCLLSRT